MRSHSRTSFQKRQHACLALPVTRKKFLRKVPSVPPLAGEGREWHKAIKKADWHPIPVALALARYSCKRHGASRRDRHVGIDKKIKQIFAGGAHAVRAQKRLINAWEERFPAEAILLGLDYIERAFETGEPQRMMAPLIKRR